MRIKNYIRLLRNSIGMTQKELAFLSGLSERQIQNIEYEQGKPLYESMIRIANAFNKSIEEVFELPGGNNSSQGELATHIEN